MFEAIQYLVLSKKLEDGFSMDNVAAMNSRGKITRSCDDSMGLDFQFNLLLFYLYIILYIYKSKRYMCLCNVGKCSSFRRGVKPSSAWFFGDGISYGTIISLKFDE